ncbi:MAG: hypothetical protein K2P35_15640 [Lachnospiraceae bacterium]|jgi:hypothetical protein|nr:hypothetical protein [Lachnospiraceae bacterium]
MINFTKSKLNRFSYAGWKRYFAQNDAHRLVISFQNYTLTEKEKKLIFPSICQFQQGERSDGKHLKKAADIFAEKIHNEDYKHCIRLFIKEENVHSGYLKSYMDHYHVDVKKNVLLDMIFRQLRKLAGIRCEVIVLVTAEIIALSYYDALMNATNDQTLKSICRQMLCDEIPHVMFQSYTLSHFKNRFYIKLIRILLMEITSAVTWVSCRKMFVSAGWTFKKFMHNNLNYLDQSLELSHIHNRTAAQRQSI